MENLRTLSGAECRLDIGAGGLKSLRFTRGEPRTLVLKTTTEFLLHLGIGEERILRDADCTVTMADTAAQLCALYDHPMLQAQVTYTLDGPAAAKRIRLTAKEPLFLRYAQTERAGTSLPLTRGGEGQPVFAGETAFIGIAFPTCMNTVRDGTLCLEQAPFIHLNAGESFELFPVIYGLSRQSTAQAGFEEYLQSRRRRAAPRRIYCDWGAHDELSGTGEPPLDENMCNQLLDTLDRAQQEQGVRFDTYLMDAFWFDPEQPYTAFKQENWPRGPEALVQRVHQRGMEFGLWFDVNMAFVRTGPDRPRRSGSEKELCLSYIDNARLFFETVEKQIRRLGIRVLKFDFAFFDCACREHATHSSRPVFSKEPAIRCFVEGIRRLREVEPSLVILAYNGFASDAGCMASVDTTRPGGVISPWWCLDVEYLYCGDPRPSEIPAANLECSLLFYTDSMIEQFRQSLIPFDAIDDHGTMLGDTQTIYMLGDRPLRDSWIMNLARGGRKEHLYGEIARLTPADWEFIQQTEPMFSFTCREDCRTSFILGSPSMGELYGYSNSNGLAGYITVVNAARQSRPVLIRLDEWLPGETVAVSCRYRRKECRQEEPRRVGGGFCETLEPDEVVVYYWERTVSQACEGLLRLDQGCTAALELPADGRRLAVRFLRNDLSPWRVGGASSDPADIVGDGVTLCPLYQRPVWSGISWRVFEPQEPAAGALRFKAINRAEEDITLQWMLIDGGDQL